MKVDWKIIPNWLNIVTAEVIDDGHGLCLDGPTAWDGVGTCPTIWISGSGDASWQDEGEHLLFATLPDYAVEFEVGDTTETCIQFRPQSIEQPEQEQELVGTVKELFTDSAWNRLNVRGCTKVYLEKDNT